MEEWKTQASALFFIEHLPVNTVADIVNRRRETVSRYLCGREGYGDEMAFRKAQSRERRKTYQQDWDKANRPERYRYISGDTLRTEHELAVKILSKERFSHE